MTHCGSFSGGAGIRTQVFMTDLDQSFTSLECFSKHPNKMVVSTQKLPTKNYHLFTWLTQVRTFTMLLRLTRPRSKRGCCFVEPLLDLHGYLLQKRCRLLFLKVYFNRTLTTDACSIFVT